MVEVVAVKRKNYLTLMNAHKQLQDEGKEVSNLWVIVASGNSVEDAKINAQIRRSWITFENITVIEDTPEARAAYGNPQAV